MRRIRRQITFAGTLVFGGAAMLLALAIHGAPALAVVGTCSPTKIKYLTDNDFRDTDSAKFVNIPQTGFNFTQGGASAGCVIVHFTAEVGTVTYKSVDIRPLLDGAVKSQPPLADFTRVDDSLQSARGFIFIFPSVAPGTHSITMQFRMRDAGGTAYIQRRTLMVQHQ